MRCRPGSIYLGNTAKHDVSHSQHLRTISLPLNPGECGILTFLTVESSRLFRPVWKVSNFQAIENKEIRSMGDARISILEVLKNQILRRTFDCQSQEPLSRLAGTL